MLSLSLKLLNSNDHDLQGIYKKSIISNTFSTISTKQIKEQTQTSGNMIIACIHETIN
jgi:hypothetical protein